MGAPNARHDVPAAGNGATSIPVPADPPPEARSDRGLPGLGSYSRAVTCLRPQGPAPAPKAQRGRAQGASPRFARALEPVEKVVTQSVVWGLSCLG